MFLVIWWFLFPSGTMSWENNHRESDGSGMINFELEELLFRDEYRSALLCEYAREMMMTKALIEEIEDAVALKEVGNSWSHDGVCFMFAKAVVDYAKMAYDNLALGHFHSTRMIFRAMLENIVCLDIILNHPEHELWKYYIVHSYKNTLLSFGAKEEKKVSRYLREIYQHYEIEDEFVVVSKKSGHKEPFAYIDKNYGWTYKINKKFSFSGLCQLIDFDDYEDFRAMSTYSHGTSIHLKMGGFSSMDSIMNMFSFFYYAMVRLAKLYCSEAIGYEYHLIADEFERIFENYD